MKKEILPYIFMLIGAYLAMSSGAKLGLGIAINLVGFALLLIGIILFIRFVIQEKI